jgi:hypothetical protein
VVADGASPRAHVLDLLSASVTEESPFAASPATLLTAGSYALAIDASGEALLLDLESGTTRALVAPAGTSFAEVVGGAVVPDAAGGAYVVGPTRSSTPSDLVVHLDRAGAVIAQRFVGARTQAAAAFIAGRGLLVAYGVGGKPGLELLPAGAAATTALAFPGEDRPGGVLVPLDGTRVLRLDAAGSGTVLDLSCGRDCAPSESAVRDDARAPRDDDHVTLGEGGALVARGGKLSLLSKNGSKLDPMFDAGAAPVCSAALSIGVIGVAVGGQSAVFALAPPR